MISIFDLRKPAASDSHRTTLLPWRGTHEQLEAEREETAEIRNLKLILTARIQEIESKTSQCGLVKNNAVIPTSPIPISSQQVAIR